eukprot:1188475-Prorocentrum_minimum.AAC.1
MTISPNLYRNCTWGETAHARLTTRPKGTRVWLMCRGPPYVVPMTIDLPFVHAMKNEEVNLGVRSIVIGTTYGGPRHINHTRVPFVSEPSDPWVLLARSLRWLKGNSSTAEGQIPARKKRGYRVHHNSRQKDWGQSGT